MESQQQLYLSSILSPHLTTIQDITVQNYKFRNVIDKHQLVVDKNTALRRKVEKLKQELRRMTEEVQKGEEDRLAM